MGGEHRELRWPRLVPKIIGGAVQVPAVAVVAVLPAEALLGIVGTLVAIPVVAALQLLTKELLFPRSMKHDDCGCR